MRTDTELAAALAEGDSAALADIYDRYADHPVSYTHLTLPTTPNV